MEEDNDRLDWKGWPEDQPIQYSCTHLGLQLSIIKAQTLVMDSKTTFKWRWVWQIDGGGQSLRSTTRHISPDQAKQEVMEVVSEIAFQNW